MKKSTKITIICISAIVAIGLVIAGLFLAFGSGNEDENKDNNSSITSSQSVTNEVNSTVSNPDRESTNVPETVTKVDVDKDSTSVTVDNIEAERGKTISVPIMLNKNPGIAASVFEIEYNIDKLEYIGYEEGEVFENYHFKELAESIAFSNIENGDSTKSGVMFYLNFKVKDDAVIGDTEIKLNITDESFINFDEEFVKISGGNAIVSIK